MKHLVVGFGEVGRALYALLAETAHVDAHDPFHPFVPESRYRHYDALHICLKFSDFKAFQLAIDNALTWFAPVSTPLVLIHSTVPIGTTTKLQQAASARYVHTPIRGTHPDLREGIRTFVKYFGGLHAKAASELFTPICPVRCFSDPETTEAIKLWDTTQYGWQIVLAKEIAAYCREHGLDFEAVYRVANQDYNRGYGELGNARVQRPHLHAVAGPIGGHCVVPNLDLLGPNRITDLIRLANASYAGESPAEGEAMPAREAGSYSGPKLPIEIYQGKRRK